MTTFNIVHTADLHLGSLFSSTPSVASMLKREQLNVLRQILDLCVQRKADALLIAGDMFDSMKVDRKLLDDVMEMLSVCEFRIFISPGNHDPATPDSCYNTEWPDNVHIFRGGMEKVEIPEKNTCVWGAGFNRTSCEQTLFENFEPVRSRINVLMLHGQLVSNEFSDTRYNPIYEEALINSGADYVALGHVHSYEHHEKNDFLCCYSGAPAGRGFDEVGEKGVLCGYAAKGFAHMEFHPLDVRQYFSEKIDVSGCKNVQQIVLQIADVLKARHGQRFTENLYDITLIGVRESENLLSPAEISDALSGVVFYAEITDMTTTSLDLELLMNDGTLRGAFVRRVVNKMQKDENNREKYIRALVYGLRAFEGDVTVNEDY